MANAITRIGTPYYLSPEICMNKPYNAKSDMWSESRAAEGKQGCTVRLAPAGLLDRVPPWLLLPMLPMPSAPYDVTSNGQCLTSRSVRLCVTPFLSLPISAGLSALFCTS
jgi:serine/threonine protein kinase